MTASKNPILLSWTKGELFSVWKASYNCQGLNPAVKTTIIPSHETDAPELEDTPKLIKEKIHADPSIPCYRQFLVSWQYISCLAL